MSDAELSLKKTHPCFFLPPPITIFFCVPVDFAGSEFNSWKESEPSVGTTLTFRGGGILSINGPSLAVYTGVREMFQHGGRKCLNCQAMLSTFCLESVRPAQFSLRPSLSVGKAFASVVIVNLEIYGGVSTA